MGRKAKMEEIITAGYEKIMYKEKVPKKVHEKTLEYLKFCFKKNLIF